MQSSPNAGCVMTVRDYSNSYFPWPLWQNCSCNHERNINQYLALIRFPDFGLQSITSLLSISQQHGSIGFVEDWIVHRCITDSQRSLHYNDLHIKSSCLKQEKPSTPSKITKKQPPQTKGEEERSLTKIGCSLLQNCVSNFNIANKLISRPVSETFYC